MLSTASAFTAEDVDSLISDAGRSLGISLSLLSLPSFGDSASVPVSCFVAACVSTLPPPPVVAWPAYLLSTRAPLWWHLLWRHPLPVSGAVSLFDHKPRWLGPSCGRIVHVCCIDSQGWRAGLCTSTRSGSESSATGSSWPSVLLAQCALASFSPLSFFLLLSSCASRPSCSSALPRCDVFGPCSSPLRHRLCLRGRRAWGKTSAHSGLLVLDVQGFSRRIVPAEGCGVGGGALEGCDWPGKQQWLKYVDLLKVDAPEAMRLTGQSELRPAITALHRLGARAVLATHSGGVLFSEVQGGPGPAGGGTKTCSAAFGPVHLDRRHSFSTLSSAPFPVARRIPPAEVFARSAPAACALAVHPGWPDWPGRHRHRCFCDWAAGARAARRSQPRAGRRHCHRQDAVS